MKISMAIFRQQAVRDQQPQVCSKMSSSKAAALFARGAYWQYVSTEKGRERRWRLFSTDPLTINGVSTLTPALSLKGRGS